MWEWIDDITDSFGTTYDEITGEADARRTSQRNLLTVVGVVMATKWLKMW